MKKLSVLLVSIIVGLLSLAFVPVPVAAMGGSGTEGNPYIIYNITDLQNMNLNLTAYYELANDIDASVTSGWNGGEGFEPISSFEGYFDGNGYTISDLSINRPTEDYVGLFGEVFTPSTIGNVHLVDVDITGAGHTGALVGETQGGIVGSCSATGNVTGETPTGGLIGWVSPGTVGNCYFSGSVVGTGYDTRGLIGGCENGAVGNHSYSSGTVNGENRVGGLIGCCVNVDGIVDESFSISDVTATGNTAGGLVGCLASAIISNCFARGYVVADNYVGGLVGSMTGLGDGYVNHSYSTGAVVGINLVGGLVGDAADGTVTNSYWDTDTSWQATSDGGTGKTTTQMKTESTFNSWDFDTIWEIDATGFLNGGYPYLQWRYEPLDIYQVLWFQPNNIISGTTLPDRATSDGSQDGEITWGSNPAGVSVGLTGFYSDYAPANITLPQEIITPPQDMVGPTGNPGNTRDVGTLVDNPFYPLIKGLSDHSGISAQLWWIILASIIVLIVMVVTYWKLPHLMITALAGGGLSAFFYAMGIYPFWVVLLFAVMALAIILGERSPTV